MNTVARIVTTVKFDSKTTATLANHSFGLGVSPISLEALIADGLVDAEPTGADWDAMAEESMMQDAIDRGVAGCSLEPLPLVEVKAEEVTIPASVNRIRFVNYNSPSPCVRYLGAWVEEIGGRVRMTFERANELYRQGRVAILADKPAPVEFKASKPAAKYASKVVTEADRYASRLAYLSAVQFDPQTDGNDWHATESLRQTRRSLATA